MYVGSFCSSPSSSRQSSRHSMQWKMKSGRTTRWPRWLHSSMRAADGCPHARQTVTLSSLVGAVAVVRGDAAACELDQPAELVHGGLLGRRPEPPTMMLVQVQMLVVLVGMLVVLVTVRMRVLLVRVLVRCCW